jgi:hypothetical protein
MLLTILCLVLSFILIIVGIELGVHKGSQSLVRTEENLVDKIAILMIYAGVLFWAGSICKFLILIFS